MIGAVISAEAVKARWAYGEIISERFGYVYQANVSPSVCRAALARVPFSQTPAEAWPGLVAALRTARSQITLDYMDQHGAPNYVCVAWSVSDLLNCWTLPGFKLKRYYEFLAHPPAASADGTPFRTDPRLQSHRIPFDPDFKVEEPLVAVTVAGRPMLFEGYLRSILWLRNPAQPLPVWVPQGH